MFFISFLELYMSCCIEFGFMHVRSELCAVTVVSNLLGLPFGVSTMMVDDKSDSMLQTYQTARFV